MYLNFFGLSEHPFAITPDTRFFFLGRSHEAALATLKFGIEGRLGFLMLTGEVGSGKTTLARVLLDRLDKNIHTSLIINPMLTVPELLREITRDFGIATAGPSPTDHIAGLNKFLLELSVQGKNALVVIDEAQNLSYEALEAIRLLTNLETDKHKLLQILLVGQPELNAKLANHNLRQLNQRIVSRVNLEALDMMEMMRYINFRIGVANGAGKIFFEQKAYRLLHRKTGGYPRLINLVCDRALMSSYVREMPFVDKRGVKLALADLQGVSVQHGWRRLKRLVFSS